MADAERQSDKSDDVEAVDFGPFFNDWVRASAVSVARLERRRDEARLVVGAEGDDNAWHG